MFLGEITRSRIFIKAQGSRKNINREMIGSSVKDFGSFCQKPLEAILYKASRQLVCQAVFAETYSQNYIFLVGRMQSNLT